MSFLPHDCHSPIILSFLPDYCHSFWISVIPSVLLSFLPNIVIPSKLFRELQILTSSKSFRYPKGEKNGHQRWPYMQVLLEYGFCKNLLDTNDQLNTLDKSVQLVRGSFVSSNFLQNPYFSYTCIHICSY